MIVFGSRFWFSGHNFLDCFGCCYDFIYMVPIVRISESIFLSV